LKLKKTERAIEKQSALLTLEAARRANNQLQRNFLATFLLLTFLRAWMNYGRIKYKQKASFEKRKESNKKQVTGPCS